MILPDSTRPHLVVIGGRSGVGKTSVANEMHAILGRCGVQHAVIEGDALDLAWPAPWKHGLAERNLAAIWSNYRELGYRRLIYTNTVSVLESATLAEAMGDCPVVTSILLECSDRIAARRLATREVGVQLATHIDRSARRAQDLDMKTPDTTIRVPTDNRTVDDIAYELIAHTGWLSAVENEITHE